MEYIQRIVDNTLDKRKEAFNAISIIGPKGCGKTRTAKERCNTIIEFQDEKSDARNCTSEKVFWNFKMKSNAKICLRSPIPRRPNC